MKPAATFTLKSFEFKHALFSERHNFAYLLGQLPADAAL